MKHIQKGEQKGKTNQKQKKSERNKSRNKSAELERLLLLNRYGRFFFFGPGFKISRMAVGFINVRKTEARTVVTGGMASATGN